MGRQVSTMIKLDGFPRVMSARHVADAYGVTAKTVVRWEAQGRLKPDFRTPGGDRRYLRDRIEQLLNGDAR